jgi:hypothetical protein
LKTIKDCPRGHPNTNPPNTKDIPCATIKSYLQAPTIQTGQTRENNIKVKKCGRRRALQSSDWTLFGVKNIRSRNLCRVPYTLEQIFVTWRPNRMRLSIKRPRSVTTSFHSSAISPKNNKGRGYSGGEFDTKIAYDLAGLSKSPFSIDQRWMTSRFSFTRAIRPSRSDRFPDK